MQTETKIYGAARTGRGKKLHPAVKIEGKVWFQCSCPGTQQGSIYHSFQFFPGAQRTCRA